MRTDELEDWEYPDPDEVDESESDTVACTACGAEIFEDAVRCPDCGHYLSAPRHTAWEGRPVWFVVLAVLGIAAVIYVLI